mmetsp:Transcript_13175/g.33104  ORF Transcript_13175/g.33104 Transcript_13175/m.33104 type:complete len:408 (-) Transcript_13175:72-1295(-)
MDSESESYEESEDGWREENGAKWKIERWPDDSSSDVMGVPVFYPEESDVLTGSFETYIEKVERVIAEHGICKIVPPPSWSPAGTKEALYERADTMTIKTPIKQNATGAAGIYRTLLVEQKEMRVGSSEGYRCLATAKENQPPVKIDPENPDTLMKIERYFWRNICYRPPIYGADTEGSLFDEGFKGWNIRDLDTMLSRAIEQQQLNKGVKIPGVISPYLYFGMWRSLFAWHTEDVDLYSINYIHFGDPKVWYCIPPKYRQRFERMVKALVPELYLQCAEFLRHKDLMISPKTLRRHNIPYVKVVQKEREAVINYPGAYHSGFNSGYNCAESTNFATKKWIAIGRDARPCECMPDAVRFDMSIFDMFSPEGTAGEVSKKRERPADEAEKDCHQLARSQESAPKKKLLQ